MHQFEPTSNTDAMDELRQRLASGQYAIDSRLVAGSLVSKMKLIHAARRQLNSAGQSPGRAAPSP